MRKLFLDIETSPHTVYAWDLFNQTISPGQIVAPSRVLCVSYQMEDDPMVTVTEWDHGKAEMLRQVRRAMHDADMLVHYNGVSFDERHLNREFLLAGMTPPSPYRSMDLYKSVRKRFKFASSKLEYVASKLELRQGKLKTDFGLWIGCMGGDPAAQKRMEEYNREDVALLKALYTKILPWIPSHPHVNLENEWACPKCGGTNVQRRGISRLLTGAYQRYHCQDCGSWSQETKRCLQSSLKSVC